MHESTPDATRVQTIDLANESDFDLGSLQVRPASCEVEWNGVSQSLQRRVMQVFVALARSRGLVVSQSELVTRCWRGLSVSDDAIVRCISKLRKLGAGYPEPPFAIETIPGVGYRLTSPNFVEHDPSADAVVSPDRRFRLRAFVAAAALAAFVLMGAAIWIIHGRAADEQQALRVAVQQFETLSTSGDVRALARRVPNEIVDALGDSQIESALAGEPRGKEGSGIARTASDLTVTGLVRDENGSTIVDVRLEDGTTHAALWSVEFKRDSEQASDLPLEVAARVADAANLAIFARTANPPLTDVSGLSALLQTSDLIRDPRGGAWAQMIERARSIVARHPDFAFGHSVLAAAYSEAAENINLPDRARAMSNAARGEANLTLKLDPEDAGGYVVLSEIEPTHNYRVREAILLRGIKYAKHPKGPLGALYQYEGLLLESVGRQREALSLQLIAQATDEWSPAKMIRLALDYANMGNLPAARNALQKATLRWPNHPSVKAARRYIAAFYEQPSDALATLELLDARTPPDEGYSSVWRSFIEARAAHSKGVTSSTVAKIREAANQGEISRENEIMMLAGLGGTRQAIEAANFALDHQDLETNFLFTPVTRDLRRDPSFVTLATRVALVKYWRETGKLPDFCTSQASRGECSPELLAALKP